MKNKAIKLVSSVLILVILSLTLTSCGIIDYFVEMNNEQNNNIEEQPQKKRYYYGAKTLYSYDDVIAALSIVKQRYGKLEHRYTVKAMGEDYIVFYQFVKFHANMEYPTDYDTYFTTIAGSYFHTFIFFENKACPGHDSGNAADNPANNLYAYKEDTDYDKLIKYKKEKACVSMATLNYSNVVEIEDVSLLSYSSRKYGDSDYAYTIYYGGDEYSKENGIVNLVSCVELDDEFFEVFFNSLVTTKPVDL